MSRDRIYLDDRSPSFGSLFSGAGDAVNIMLGLLLIAFLGVSFADYTPDWPSLDSRPIPSWYNDAKFGIFIHWGVFSVPSYGSEHFWYRWKVNKDPEYVDFMKNNYPPNFEYQDFAPMFKAELWDPAKWATLFKHSGAKFVTILPSH